MTTTNINELLGDYKLGDGVNARLPWVEPGKYRVRVKEIRLGKAWNGRRFFVAHFTVLESVASEAGKTPLPVGADFAWMQMLDNPVSGPNIKGMLGACFGVPPATVETSHMAMAADDRNGSLPGGPLAALGVEVNLNAWSGQAKVKKTPITMTSFTSVSGKTLRDLQV